MDGPLASPATVRVNRHGSIVVNEPVSSASPPATAQSPPQTTPQPSRTLQQQVQTLGSARGMEGAPAPAPPRVPAFIDLVRSSASDDDVARVVARLALHAERGSAWSKSWAAHQRDVLDGSSALHAALRRRRSPEVVLAILSFAPDGVREEPPSATCIEIAMTNHYGSDVLLPIIAQEPWSCRVPFTTDGRPVLYHALMTKCSPAVVEQIFLKNPAAARFVDAAGTTMLHLATLRKHPPTVLDLFVEGAMPSYLRVDATQNRVLNPRVPPKSADAWRRDGTHRVLRGAGASPRVPGMVRTTAGEPSLSEKEAAWIGSRNMDATTAWLAQAQGFADRVAQQIPSVHLAGGTRLGEDGSALRKAQELKMRNLTQKYGVAATAKEAPYIRSYHASGTMLRTMAGRKYQTGRFAYGAPSTASPTAPNLRRW